MAISAPARRMACAQPQAIEWSFATATTSAFLPASTGGSRPSCGLGSGMRLSSAVRRRNRVPRNDQVLVGRDDMSRDTAAPRGEAARVGGIGDRVEFDAQPRAGFADHGPYRRRVLADAGSEDQAVQ